MPVMPGISGGDRWGRGCCSPKRCGPGTIRPDISLPNLKLFSLKVRNVHSADGSEKSHHTMESTLYWQRVGSDVTSFTY